MADKLPLKLVDQGSGQGALREFESGDTLPDALVPGLANKVSQTAQTGAAVIPSGTTAERPPDPFGGLFRYNKDTNDFEGYKNGAWGAIGGGGGGGSGLTVYAKAINSANVSVPNATFVEISLNTTLTEAGGDLHNPAVNPQRITIPAGAAGAYVVGGAAFFTANATGRRVIRIQKNGTTSIVREDKQAVSTSGASTGILGSTMTYLEEGDYVTCQVYQDSGATLEVQGLAEYTPQLWVARVGS